MVISEEEDDPVTTANTAINQSMILMDKDLKSTPKPKSRRSITINTSIQAASTPIQNGKNIRKSILKKPDQSQINEHDLTDKIIKSPVINRSWLNDYEDEVEKKIPIKSLKRPLNIDEFQYNENLKSEDSPPIFCLDDIDKNDELWIMEIPKSVDVKELIGQSLSFNTKTTLKFDKKKYRTSIEGIGEPLTCVLPKDKTENNYINASFAASGLITVRRKLASGEVRATFDEDME